ncbi:MAG: tRNA (guanosine(46)-N7)-methyltransferase TrmB [Phycisphaerales bacterium]
MSFGLSRGRDLDTSGVEVERSSLPPLPDDILSRPEGGFVDLRSWFNEPGRPLEIEIGSGKGTFLLNAARESQEVNLFGMEYAREFFVYAADRVRRAGLRNVRMMCVDATEFIRWRCPSAMVSVIHLYYSDPWPKSRHHKNRVVQDEFLRQAWRVLAPGGELRVVTDHVELWAWDLEHFARVTVPGPGALFEMRPFEPPGWADGDEVIGTNYERKTRAAGREPNSAVLRKIG